MLQRVVLSSLMALAWMPLTAAINLESYAVGFVLSFAVLTVISAGNSDNPDHVQSGPSLKRFPSQALAAALYTLILFRDIYLSAIDVAKRVINPELPLNPGIIAVSTQYTPTSPDDATADAIAAISAHGITITPGELVVDFDGNQTMYVHCLDVNASAAAAESNQAKRLKFLRRIFS